MRDTVRSIEAQLQRYKKLGEGAIEQLADADLGWTPDGGGNSVIMLVWHISGNLASRFTDFLTSDGEKPWRDRESEFVPRRVDRIELLRRWESGWRVLENALQSLGDSDLEKPSPIRGQPMTVREALHRSLAHTSYHVGQIVYLAKSITGAQWRYLSSAPASIPGVAPQPQSRQGKLAEMLERTVSGLMWHGPALVEILKDISAVEASARPAVGAHSIGQLVRHIEVWATVARERLLGSTAKDPTPEEDWPAVDQMDEAKWQEMNADMAESYRRLAEMTRGMTPGQLEMQVPGRSYSVEDMLHGVIEHGAYHGGQAAILRRALRSR